MSQWEARMSELVHYDPADQVVTLTLDSPHNRNALSRQLVAELTGRLAEASAEPSAQAQEGIHAFLEKRPPAWRVAAE
jgi:enoyl-CoA hydratase/carnithine racemase